MADYFNDLFGLLSGNYVGLDEYDAPVNNRVFTVDFMGVPDAIKKDSRIEQLFKEVSLLH